MIWIFVGVAISFFIYIYIIVTDYLIYRRLNRLTDQLIGDEEMPIGDKRINLSRIAVNCMRLSSQSLVWSRKYDLIISKIKGYLVIAKL